MTRQILYRRTHHSALTIEPATIPAAYTPKEAKQEVALSDAWQKYILALNGGDLRIFEKIVDPQWGPSTGISNGKLHLIVLGYWMNAVNVLGVANGWARVACLNVNNAPPDITRVNKNTAPDLIHRVTMQNKANQLVETGVYQTDHAYVPLIGLANYMYFPASLVAAAARVTAMPWLNVRSAPSAKAPKVGTLYPLIDTVQPLSVFVGEGGVWAEIYGGFVALRYNGQLMTTWQV